MGKLKITLKNDLENKKVRVTEGNAGVTRMLKTLEPGQTYKLEIDPNATYREYIFITLPDESPLRVVSSDDFADYKEISICAKDGTYDWTGTPRKESPGQAAPSTVVPPSEKSTTSSPPSTPPWWKAVLGKFGFRL